MYHKSQCIFFRAEKIIIAFGQQQKKYEKKKKCHLDTKYLKKILQPKYYSSHLFAFIFLTGWSKVGSIREFDGSAIETVELHDDNIIGT